MKIYEKLLNSTKYKKTINKLEYYWYYFQDFIFYLYSLLLTVNKRANVKIITASDYKFYDSLIQLIDSIIIHEPNTNIVVYDIGLMTSHIEELKKTNRVELKTFDFEKYPKFLSERDKFGKLGAYAWKSAILNEVLEHENKDIVLWLDAGNILTSSLKRLKKVVLINNFYSPLSAGNLIDWCHPKTLQYLNAPKYIFKKANLTGGLVAFNTASSFAKDLAKKWYKNSMIEDCIAPPDSDRNNHRQDQSVLSILFYLDSNINYSPKTKSFFSIKVNQNPGKKVYLLDSTEKTEFKISWLMKQDDITTNTISYSDTIWVLNIEDLNKIQKKFLRSKKLIINIFSNEDLNYFLERKNNKIENSNIFFLIFDLKISDLLVNKNFLIKNIYNLKNKNDQDKLRSIIISILSI
jgi:hypothetical protein